MRPELPLLRVWSQQLSEILRMCWDRDPSMRPAFSEVDRQVQQLRARYGADLKESPAPRRSELERMKTKKSPDMHPIPLPLLPRESMPSFSSTRANSAIPPSAADTTASFVEVGSVSSTDVSFVAAADLSSSHSQSDPADLRLPDKVQRDAASIQVSVAISAQAAASEAVCAGARLV